MPISKKFALASSNRGKLHEIQALLADLDVEIVPQSAFTGVEAEESGLTFVENAIIKARHAARASGLPSLADDSGLEVDALSGAPGVRSARYAGTAADDSANNAKLLQALADVDEARRTARFHCVIVFLRYPDDPSPLISQGVWEGRIAWRPEGTGGFGYDPLFIVPEKSCTAAQLDSGEKNRLSHRGKAVREISARLHALLAKEALFPGS